MLRIGRQSLIKCIDRCPDQNWFAELLTPGLGSSLDITIIGRKNNSAANIFYKDWQKNPTAIIRLLWIYTLSIFFPIWKWIVIDFKDSQSYCI